MRAATYDEWLASLPEKYQHLAESLRRGQHLSRSETMRMMRQQIDVDARRAARAAKENSECQTSTS